MRQLAFIKKGLVEWHEVPEPRLTAPVQVIVRPFVAARCDGDCVPPFHSLTNLMNAGIALHLLDPLATDVLGPTPFREPFAFGHECIATALAVGGDVRTVAVGDQAIAPWAISCGRCFACLSATVSNTYQLSGFGSAISVAGSCGNCWNSR